MVVFGILPSHIQCMLSISNPGIPITQILVQKKPLGPLFIVWSDKLPTKFQHRGLEAQWPLTLDQSSMLDLPEVKSFSRIALGINEKCKLCMYFHRKGHKPGVTLTLTLSHRGGGGNDKFIYYVLYSLPVFSLAKSLQLILEIRATYKLVSYLLAD